MAYQIVLQSVQSGTTTRYGTEHSDKASAIQRLAKDIADYRRYGAKVELLPAGRVRISEPGDTPFVLYIEEC